MRSVRGQNHRQRPEFALEGVKDEPQHLQRDTAEKNAIILLAEDNRGGAFVIIETKQGLAHTPSRGSSVGQNKAARGAWLDAHAT